MSDQEKQAHPLVVLKSDLDRRSDEFAAALPSHMPVERFRRVILTAVQRNPKLLNADRRSFWNAAMQAAQDGLLPDGREGAMVIYRTNSAPKGEPKNWVDMVQWMPMIFGILKKIRNSGELAAITARIVYGGDKFRYWVDDDGEHILYEPAENPDTTIIRRVFAMAKTKDGAVYAEPMTVAEIEKVRQSSRAKDSGPWIDWWEQMALKTALRRMSKRLPMSSDLDDLIRRDDALYDMEGASDREAKPRMTMAQKFDAIAGAGAQAKQIEHKPAATVDMTASSNAEPEPVEASKPRTDTRRAEATTDTAHQRSNRTPQPMAASDHEETSEGDSREQTPKDIAFDAGYAARRDGRSRKAVPKDLSEAEAAAWGDGWEMADAEMEG